MSKTLEELLVDGTELDKTLVAEILSSYIKIDKNTCEIRPLQNWNKLTAYTKILIYLLARKAMKALKLNIEEESAANNEIINSTGLKKGTVHPALRELYEKKLVVQTKDQKYYIPNYAIERVKETITKE